MALDSSTQSRNMSVRKVNDLVTSLSSPLTLLLLFCRASLKNTGAPKMQIRAAGELVRNMEIL